MCKYAGILVLATVLISFSLARACARVLSLSLSLISLSLPLLPLSSLSSLSLSDLSLPLSLLMQKFNNERLTPFTMAVRYSGNNQQVSGGIGTLVLKHLISNEEKEIWAFGSGSHLKHLTRSRVIIHRFRIIIQSLTARGKGLTCADFELFCM